MNNLIAQRRLVHRPGPILLAAQARVFYVRWQDARLKRQIRHMMKMTTMSYEQARRYVLASRGLLK